MDGSVEVSAARVILSMLPYIRFFLTLPSREPDLMNVTTSLTPRYCKVSAPPLTVREVKVMHMPPKPFIAKAKKIRMDRSEGEKGTCGWSVDTTQLPRIPSDRLKCHCCINSACVPMCYRLTLADKSSINSRPLSEYMRLLK